MYENGNNVNNNKLIIKVTFYVRESENKLI